MDPRPMLLILLLDALRFLRSAWRDVADFGRMTGRLTGGRSTRARARRGRAGWDGGT